MMSLSKPTGKILTVISGRFADRNRGMEHSACLEELNDVEEFIASRLPPKSS